MIAAIITAQAVEIMKAHFRLPIAELGVRSKAEAETREGYDSNVILISDVTRTDEEIAAFVAEAIGRDLGGRVVSEEHDSIPQPLRHLLVQYGADGWYNDPVDSTHNYREALEEPNPDLRSSNGMFSLGRVRNGQPDMGIVAAPLVLGHPTQFYGAEIGKGAFVCNEDGICPLSIDTAAKVQKGAVLVSANEHDHINYLNDLGYTVIPLDGFVFKLCAMLDRTLIDAYAPGLVPAGMPIVGFISNSASAHDYAAGAVIAREAHAVVTAKNGSTTINMHKGRNGLLVADNQKTHQDLVDAIRYEQEQRTKQSPGRS